MIANVYKLYIPSGHWIVETLTRYCMENGIGNAEVGGIGSIGNVWTLVDPAGTPVVKLSDAEPSYEMTSFVANVTLRQGLAQFDRSKLPSGAYPQFDSSVETYNCYVHAHVMFADAAMMIWGGHLLDAQITIGAELVVRPLAGSACVPGLLQGDIPADCVFDEPVPVPPFGTFSNWNTAFWYPPIP